MRNYIAELKSTGVSYNKIAKQTDVSASTISRIARGEKLLNSSSKLYKNVRNISRRAGYQEAKKAGYTSKEAHKRQRVFIKKDGYKKLDTPFTHSTRHVKAKQDTTVYQLWIKGLFRNIKTKKYAKSEGFSYATSDIRDSMLDEAINEARNKLGGTNWELVELYKKELMNYVITSED